VRLGPRISLIPASTTARGVRWRPAGVIYERFGLSRTEHNAGRPLAPDARYPWTVRVRLELDRRARVTDSGTIHLSGQERAPSPALAVLPPLAHSDGKARGGGTLPGRSAP